jgi:hypothetical protein
LESVQHVHHTGEAHGINRPAGVAVEIIDQLQSSTAAESFQRWLPRDSDPGTADTFSREVDSALQGLRRRRQ